MPLRRWITGEDIDRDVAGLGTVGRGVQHPSVGDEGVEDVGAGGAGDGEALRCHLDPPAELGIQLHYCRPTLGRVGLGRPAARP